MTDESGLEMVSLRSKEGDIFQVHRNVACKSIIIKEIVDDSGAASEIPLPTIKTKVLSEVLNYCKFGSQSTFLLSKWDANYIRNIGPELLKDLKKAANYLDIKALLDLTSMKISWLNDPFQKDWSSLSQRDSWILADRHIVLGAVQFRGAVLEYVANNLNFF